MLSTTTPNRPDMLGAAESVGPRVAGVVTEGPDFCGAAAGCDAWACLFAAAVDGSATGGPCAGAWPDAPLSAPVPEVLAPAFAAPTAWAAPLAGSATSPSPT